MKNRKLYQSIQKLVNHKEYRQKKKEDFAHEYCNQQMKKKKLVSRGNRQKIDHLMANFKGIKTFVEVDDLVKCVNDLYVQQQKQKKEQIKNKLKTHKIFTHACMMSENVEPLILNKAKSTIKNHRKNTYDADNCKLKELIDIFQQNSNYLCQTMRNNINNRYVSQITDIQKRKGSEKKRDSSQSETKEKWNNYSRSNLFVKTEPNQKQRYFYDNLKSRPFHNHKQKQKMFELAQIYLHIILEQEHRKKWSKTTGQLKLSPPKILEKSIQKKLNALRSSFMNSNTPDLKSSYEISKLVTTNNIDNSTQSTYHFLRSRSRNNTKVKRNKQIAMKKVNNFLLELEQDQNCLRNQKTLQICQLNRLEKHLRDEDEFRQFGIWGDEEKCREIKNALDRQDGR